MPHFVSFAKIIATITVFTCAIICMMVSSLTLAQPVSTMLKGKVIINHQGGSAAANIAISAEGGQQTTTDGNGRFTMVFDKTPGEPYELLVNKEGWAVINSHVLTGHLPSVDVTKHSTPLSIIIAKEQDYQQYATAYYRIKLSEFAEQSYQEQLAKLKDDNQALKQQLAEDRDKAIAHAKEAAQQLAKANTVNTTNSLYQQARKLYLENSAQAALEILNDVLIQAVLDKRKEQDQNLINALLLKANIHVSNLDFKAADKVYTQLANNFGDSIDAQFYAGLHFQQQNQFSAAIRSYKKALLVDGISPEYRATILNNLGILYNYENNLDEAHTAYNEALDIYRKLAKINPSVYLPNVALTLNNLGNLHTNENRISEALIAYNESLELRRKLAKTNPSVYLPDVAMTLNNLGNLHRAENHMDKALTAYNEAIDTRRKLAKTNPSVYLPDVAETLNNLGVLHKDKKRMSEALKAFNEALEIRRKLAKTNPSAYLPDIAAILHNLGNLYGVQNRMAAAQTAFNEALEIQSKLAKTNPNVYLPYVAATLNGLGVLYAVDKDFHLANKHLFEAKDIYLKFTKQAPNRFNKDLDRINRAIQWAEQQQNANQQ